MKATSIISEECAACGKKVGEDGINCLKNCSACKLVKYCSVTCQRNHRPHHKRECKRRAAEIFDEALFKQPPLNEDCPVCLLPMPLLGKDHRYQPCCGKWLCGGCVLQGACVQQSGSNDNGTIVVRTALNVCPFCREPHTENEEEIKEQFRRRMEAGDSGAFYYVGCKHNKGDSTIWPQDVAKTVEHWLKAAEVGSSDTELGAKLACSCLATAYDDGYGVQKDEKKRIHYLQRAAMAGDVISRRALGQIESSINFNLARAKKHFIIAASSGCAPTLKTFQRACKIGYVSKEEYLQVLRAYQRAHDEMWSKEREEFSASKLRLMRKQEILEECPGGLFGEPWKESTQDEDTQNEDTDAEYLIVPQIKSDTVGKEEDQELPGCSKTKTQSLWRPQNGQMSFLGIVNVPGRGPKKLNNPVDYVYFDQSAKGEDIDRILPGHYMTEYELMSEFTHCDDSELEKYPEIGKYLIDYRNHQKKSGSRDEFLYPFHSKLVPPYVSAPSPKVRSDDIIEVTVLKDMDTFGFVVKAGTPIHVYVLSLTSAGIVTGVVETNKDHYWACFPIHHARKLVKRGVNWIESHPCNFDCEKNSATRQPDTCKKPCKK